MKLKINQDLSTPKGKLKKGAVIDVDCAKGDLPLNRFWRNRILDSEIDNCVEIITGQGIDYKESKIEAKIKTK